MRDADESPTANRGDVRSGVPGARSVVLAVGAALLAFGVAACGGGDAGTRGPSASLDSDLHGAVLPEARPKADFTLTATDGEPYDFRRETEGEVALLFFGYTHCPNACPVQMATLGAAYEKLPMELQQRVEVVFVSTDPARDTLPRLRSWLDNFSESFVGLRGSRDEVNRIMREYDLPPAQIDTTPSGPGNPGDGYTVGHAAHVLVFTPDGRLRLMYPTGTRQRDWVEDLRELAREGTDAVTGGASAGSGSPAGGG